LLGLVGFVVVGTLYHVLPFIVWLQSYADRVGLEPVPTIDELYDGRIAAAGFWLALTGAPLVVAGQAVDLTGATVAGGLLATLAFCLVAANLLGVVVQHGPASPRFRGIGRGTATRDDVKEVDDGSA
jgi:hypothetical protein